MLSYFELREDIIDFQLDLMCKESIDEVVEIARCAQEKQIPVK